MYKIYTKNLCMPPGYIQKMLLIMKLTTFILIISIMQVTAASFGQNVTLKQDKVSMTKLFYEIRKQTGYNVMLEDKNVLSAKKINADFMDTPLEKVMDLVVQGTGLTYVIEDKTIVVKEKSFIDKVIDYFGNIDVSGRITDENGSPLPGATVKIKGTNTSASTDANGKFLLRNVANDAILEISYLGYQVKEVRAAKEMGSIKLALSVGKLDEVTINAGYYSVTDRQRTGNIQRITSETIDRQPINNPLQALQGRVTGVVIEQTTGIPGGGFNVQIRGRSSINPGVGNNPLYIVDGVIYPSSSISSTNSTSILTSAGANPLSFINPYDIESIDILKDADATAIYGSRGANGVIIITTTRGGKGDTKINAAISQGFSEVGHRLDLLNTQQYLDMREEAFRNDGLTPSSTDYDLNGMWESNKYTDWQEVLIGGTANTTNASLNISGGTDKSSYSLGANYYQEGTVYPGSFGLNRIALHSSLNFGNSRNRLSATFTSNFSHTATDLLRTDLTGQILLPPNMPDTYDQYGNLNWANGTIVLNPMSLLLRTNNAETNNFIANLNLNYRMVKDFVFKTSVGYSTITREEFAKTPFTSVPPSFGPTTASRIADFSDNFNNSLIVEPQFNYTLKLGSGQVDALLGGSYQNNFNRIRTIRGTGFNSDELMENIGSASTLTVNGISYSQYRYAALFARLNYNLKGKYLLNLTARRDGSSRFGDGKQFANFGAIGAAWIFSEEGFIRERMPFLSFGKLRTSYGITGNDQIPNYGYLQLWNSQGTYQGLNTIAPVRIGNASYSWETNRKSEIALQLGFLRDRITFESSYYRNRSSNQLVFMPLSWSTGSGSIQGNLPATVQNSGWEFLTNFKVLDRGLKWDVGVNLTIPKNKLVNYPGGLEGTNYANTYIIGEPLTITKTNHVIGVNAQTGLYDIEDVDKNGVLDNIDNYMVQFIGQKYYGGLQNSIQFKEFSIDFLFSFNKQTGPDYKTSAMSPGYFSSGGPTGNQLTEVLKRWQKPGDNSEILKFSTTSASFTNYANATSATRGGLAIVDASYIRLKNASISYNLPKSALELLKLSQARFSIQGQNLFTITNYIGLDPETRSLNILPPLRSISLGLNLTF
jgi:TonB-linked SusC/RagA family outer membrane protein